MDLQFRPLPATPRLADPGIGLAHRPPAAHLLDEAQAGRRRERAGRLERDAVRREVCPGVADAHVNDSAHVTGREEDQVVERDRCGMTDDVDRDLAVGLVGAGPDGLVDRLDLA